MNDTIKTLLERRSIRKFKAEQIKDEELELVIKTGLYAPTAKGEQPWLIIAVQNKEELETLARMNAAVLGTTGNNYYDPPTIILVLAKADAREPVCDCSLAIGNMLNAAHALGLGACWINREKEMFESEEGKALLKKWGVEGDYIGVGGFSLGYPDGEIPKAKPRRENTVLYIK